MVPPAIRDLSSTTGGVPGLDRPVWPGILGSPPGRGRPPPRQHPGDVARPAPRRTSMIEIRAKDSNSVLLRIPADELAGASLAGLALPGADLAGADLRGVDLRGTDLCKSRLAGADLRGAHLDGADLTSADLTDADLGGAHLTDAMFLAATL